MNQKHTLSLAFPQSSNVHVLRIQDESLYAEGMGTDCGTLQVTVPGFTTPVSIEVLPNFSLVLNACTLGLQSSGCGSYNEVLPDGIYTVRYSLSPHDKVLVEYDHLRATQAWNRYYNFLAQLELSACEPSAEVKTKLAELRLIRSYMEAATAQVEWAHQPQQGLELLIYSQKRMDRLLGVKCL